MPNINRIRSIVTGAGDCHELMADVNVRDYMRTHDSTDMETMNVISAYFNMARCFDEIVLAVLEELNMPETCADFEPEPNEMAREIDPCDFGGDEDE